MKCFRLILTSVFSVFLLSSAVAHDYTIGKLLISHPHIPATVKAAPVAAGYVIIVNTGDEADRLLEVKADFSAKQQLHTMKVVDGIARMRPLKNGIEIPANSTVKLKQGGDHMMFMQLNEQMEAGQLRDVTLVFEKAGPVKVGMIVLDPEDLEEDDSDAHSDHSNHSSSHSGHTN